MIYSMTGYGKGEYEKEGHKFIVEIKSINHRFQEMNVRLPKIISELEDKVRKKIKEDIHRGKIDVFISYESMIKQDTQMEIDIQFVEKYLEKLKYLRDQYGLIDDISVGAFANHPEVFIVKQSEQDYEILWDILNIAMEISIKNLLIMRRQEGEKLKEDLLDKINIIEEKLYLIKQKSPMIVMEYKEKLEKRLLEWTQGKTVIDPSRLEMEVAFFADKANIDEEITRLYSHISQMKSTLAINEPVGRKLDFIVQELNREINTIGSKGNNISVSSLVIEIKSEIEKIREQIQNIQ